MSDILLPEDVKKLAPMRELLELAAVACGHCTHGATYSGEGRIALYIEHPVLKGDAGAYVRWNPLFDDGDSARMRSALKISVLWEPFYICDAGETSYVHCAQNLVSWGWSEKINDHNGDHDAALRMCALLVAAELGRKRVEGNGDG